MANILKFLPAARKIYIAIALVVLATIGISGGRIAASATTTSYSSRWAIFQEFGKTYHVTPILVFRAGKWILVGRQQYGLGGVRVLIFHLVDHRWMDVYNTDFKADQSGFFVDGSIRNELRLSSITQSSDPDVILSTTSADYSWLSIISDAGGKWHALRFDYSTEPTIAIDAFGVRGHLVIAETDTCEFSCAQGPETYAWYHFNGAMFVPTQPPGTPAPCSPQLLTSVVRDDGANDVSITRVDCKDGWAIGAGNGKHGRASGAFEQIRSKWVELAFNDSGETDDSYRRPLSDYYLFAIPYSLTEQLCRGVGESAKWVIAAPILRTAYLAYLKHGLFPS